MDELSLLDRQVSRSLSIIERMLRLCQTPYIALSFGKDSLVMMDLVYRLAPGTKCIFLTSKETYLLHNFERLINYYQASHNLNLKVVYGDELETSESLDEARQKRQGNWYFDDFLKHDGVFMGLRAEESSARRMTVFKGDGIIQYQTPPRTGQYRACPLGHWKTWDIMHYCTHRPLPLLEVYQHGGHIRTTARIPRAEHRGSMLTDIKRTNPERYNLLIKAIPELKNYS